MATGASTCDLAVILIDARYGVQTQTKRHSFIASLLGIKHIIVAINKMDLVGYSEATYRNIQDDYLAFIKSLDLHDVHFIPMSALDGDNVVNPSANMLWFTGKPMMELLNTIEIASDRNFVDARFPVQFVNRPNLDFRGFCGTVASGVFRKGDAITVMPSGKTSHIKSIVTYDGELEQAFAAMAVTLTLTDEIDISRGDIIVGQHQAIPSVADKFKASIVWMTEQPMTPGRQYMIKMATRSVSGSISLIHHRIDVNTLEHHDANELKLNEIGHCTLAVNAPVVFEPYKRNKSTGSFIIIDRLTNITVGAGMITGEASEDDWQPVSPEERATRFAQKAVIIALSGNNARQLAYHLERKLFDTGHASTVLEHAFATAPGITLMSESGPSNDALANAIKNAGLLCLCVDYQPSTTDIAFDCNLYSIDEIYMALKNRGVIH